MRARKSGSVHAPFSALAALALGLSGALAACGPADAPLKRPGQSSMCDANKLDDCERAIARPGSKAEEKRALVAAYAAARASADSNDPWAKLWNDLAASSAKEPLVILEEGAASSIEASVKTPHRAIKTTALPDPKAIAAADLILAMGEAAGAAHIVHLRAGKATELFPADPLTPFLMGLRPVLRGDADPAHINAHARVAAHVKSAIDAASAFDYVKAASSADELSAALNALDPKDKDSDSEPIARGRYALQLLSAAGLVLDAADAANAGSSDAASDTARPPDPEAPAPSPEDTPYGDLVRVRIAADSSAAWPSRSASILAAVPADRREAVPTLFRKANDCSALHAPPMESARDLVFAGRLATSLDKGVPSPTTVANADALLPLPEWYKRYEILAQAVSDTRSMWSYATSLLYERGEVSGLSPAGTSTYARVTELGQKHLNAVQALERAYPDRYRALSHLGLVYSAGLLGDPALRDGIIRLTQATVQDKIAHASDARGVFEGALTGVFAGMSYPPAIQEAHYLALQGAFTAKLKGDMLTRTGWGVAGLYAADALFRVVTDQNKNLGFSADQIARSLADSGVAMPSLAALATSFSRYAALAMDGHLEPEQKLDRFPPERRAAREALKNAIARLGDKDDEVPKNVLDDVTDLADGVIAALPLAFSASKTDAASKPDAGRAAGTSASAGATSDAGAAECSGKDKNAGPSPAVRRVVARLSDVRRHIFLHPRYKSGEGAWVRRVKLLVTLLSDAIDIVGKTTPRPVFTIADADAESAVTAALRDWDERAAADAIGGAYAMARRGIAAKNADGFLKQNGQNLRRVLSGIAAFIKDDKAGASSAATDPTRAARVGLLDALASLPLANASEGDLMTLLLSSAEIFYAKDQIDQGDLWLLSTLVLSGITESPPPPPVLALADKRSKRLSWVLRFLADVGHAREGSVPDPSSYEAGMRKATDDACAVANPDDVLAVTNAIKAFAAGDPRSRAGARSDLDRALASMESRGLNVPKMTYKYEEKTVSKIFSVTLGFSYGGGMLEGANTFQVGLGVKSPGEPGGSMTASLSPPDAAAAGEEVARYYIHAAALAAAYHFMDGDVPHATAAARRAIDALAFGVRLGGRIMPAGEAVKWGADARAMLAIDAQLAAEADAPFLAGDLWATVRASLARDADDAAVADVLSGAPFGLAALKDEKAIRERAAKSLKIVASRLPCSTAKVELGAFEETACEAYPLALSLRIGDALKKLPRLRPGGGSSRRCASAKTLDTFLAAADKGTYDPDAFTAAVESRRADGDEYGAAMLLTHQRRDAHCSPAIVNAARALARSDVLGPTVHADLLSAAVNCSIASPSAAETAEVLKDLTSLDAETQKLPDLTRNLRLLLSVTELSVQAGKDAPLLAIATQPSFIDRWMRVNPTAATAALLIENAARTLSAAGPADFERTQAAYALLCETFPAGDRAPTCAAIKALRPPFTSQPASSLEARQKRAKEALTKLLAEASGPAPAPAPSP